MNGSVLIKLQNKKKRQTGDEEEDNNNWQPASGQGMTDIGCDDTALYEIERKQAYIPRPREGKLFPNGTGEVLKTFFPP